MQKNTSHKNNKLEQTLKPFKAIIKKAIYPKFGNSLSLSTGKLAIQAYKNTTNDSDGVLELMMFYVECGNKFTVDYGDIDEHFYYSIEIMFEKVVSTIKNSEKPIIDAYLPRLIEVVKSADCIGWGYYDQIKECLQEAFTNAEL
jgi:hypothetical protein